MARFGNVIDLLDQSLVEQERARRPGWVTTPTRRNHWATLDPADFAAYPKLDPLPYLKECRLIERAQAGDLEARNIVWMQHLRLVYSVANRFHFHQNDMPDGLQEGAIGLSRAVAGFEIHRYAAFSTYAWYWIGSRMRRYAHLMGYRVRIPAHLDELYHRFRRELTRCRSANDWFDLRTRWLDADEKVYGLMLRLHALADCSSLDRTHSPLAVDTEPADAIFRSELPAVLAKAVAQLADRERFIIVRRFGFDGAPPETLQQIAEHLSYTRERIRQIETASLATLRGILRDAGTCPTDGARPQSAPRACTAA